MLSNILPLNMIISVSVVVEIESFAINYYGGASTTSTIYSTYTKYQGGVDGKF